MTIISKSVDEKVEFPSETFANLEQEEVDVDDSLSSITFKTETVLLSESGLENWRQSESILDRTVEEEIDQEEEEQNEDIAKGQVVEQDETKLKGDEHADERSTKSYSKYVTASQTIVVVALIAILIGVLFIQYDTIKALFETKEKPTPWKIPLLLHQSTHNLYDGKQNLQVKVFIPINNSLENDFYFSVKVEDSKYVKMYNFSTFELKHNSSHPCFQDYLVIENVNYDPNKEFMVNYTMPIRTEKNCFEHNFTKLPNEFSFQVKVKDIAGNSHFFTFNQTIRANFFMGKFEKILTNLNGKIVKFLSIGKSGSAKSTGIVELFFFRDISNTPELPIDLPSKMVPSHVTLNVSEYNMSFVPAHKQYYQFPLPIIGVDPMGFLNVTDFDKFLITGRLPLHVDLVSKCKNKKDCLKRYATKPISMPDVILYYIYPDQVESQAIEINQRLQLIADHGITCILMFPSGNFHSEVDLSFINGRFANKFFLYDFYRRDDPGSANNPNIYKRNADLLMRMLEIANGKRVSEQREN